MSFANDVTFEPTVSNRGTPVLPATNREFSLVQIYPVNIVDGLTKIDANVISIGRESTNDLVLEDSSVSRCHAKIEKIETGFIIRDCGSTNGTFVDEQPIDQKRLSGGETIRFGSHIFKFLSDGIEAQYHSTVYNAMTRDGLTGAYNKNYMYDALDHEMARSRRSGNPTSVLLSDIDHFKQINDQYGHLAGDQVLREFCHRLQASVRPDSLVCRYGGEEFAIILGETSLADAIEIAERCRAAVCASPIETNVSSIPTTVSIGAAEMPSNDDSFTANDLLKLADERLYEAKRSGRNRVCPK